MNKITTIISILLFATILMACRNNDLSNTFLDGEAVFFNGNIYTVNPNQPWAEAMYIKDGIIKFVGNSAEAQNMASEEADFIDLEEAFVMPGIHDVHLHPLEAATNNFQFILDDGIEDPEIYADDIADAMEQHPGDENDWLLGWGHWIDVPLAAERLPKEIIDDVALARPVAIMEQTSHSVWCNSLALELLGIDNNTPNPPGGIFSFH